LNFTEAVERSSSFVVYLAVHVVIFILHDLLFVAQKLSQVDDGE
jgi:hypothetical protein